MQQQNRHKQNTSVCLVIDQFNKNRNIKVGGRACQHFTQAVEQTLYRQSSLRDHNWEKLEVHCRSSIDKEPLTDNNNNYNKNNNNKNNKINNNNNNIYKRMPRNEIWGLIACCKNIFRSQKYLK